MSVQDGQRLGVSGSVSVTVVSHIHSEVCSLLISVQDGQRLGVSDSVSVTFKCLIYTVKCVACLYLYKTDKGQGCQIVLVSQLSVSYTQ